MTDVADFDAHADGAAPAPPSAPSFAAGAVAARPNGAGNVARPSLTATYRLQFGPDLDFAGAVALVPHLDRLGISHVYASPLTTAPPGSTHGYDVADPTQISPALGGLDGLKALSAELHRRGMGLVVDIVPNHMAAHRANAAWMEVLELGRAAPRAAWFDVDWEADRIALPWLADDLDACLADGSIAVEVDVDAARLLVVHHDHAVPLRPATSGAIIAETAHRLGDAELEAAARTWAGIEAAAASAEAIAAARARLSAALAANEEVLGLLRGLAGRPSETAANALSGILGVQHWSLASWRSRQERIGYRRFFEIDGLVGVRIEDAAVFEAVHALPVSLARDGIVDGLRVDHVDGLADPEGYCARLRAAVGPGVTVHVEKILMGSERLRPWPIEGTTGYEALNDINGLFVDPAGWRALRAAARRIDPSLGDPARTRRAKRALLDGPFAPELARLVADAADALAAAGPDAPVLREAVAGLAAAFPVYRSYLTDAPTDADAELLAQATETAAKDGADGPALRALTTLLAEGCSAPAERFRRRFQQLTGALMAKGYEDTELYRDVAFAPACEVGGHVADPTLGPATFHGRMAERRRTQPFGLTPLSTHDTKRSADVRARLDVLAERADDWLEALARWRRLTEGLRGAVDGGPAPDGFDELTLFQGLVGAAPVSGERLSAFMVKAMREAKRRSQWASPDADYEDAVTGFARALAEDPAAEAFRDDLARFLPPLVRAGRTVSLAQVILQMTVPGVPDIYQGSERWDLSLVDPDNRRPVDWKAIEAMSVDGPLPDLDSDEEGEAKLKVTMRLAALRRRLPELFLAGEYRPLPVSDAGPAQPIAFARSLDAAALIVVVPTRGDAVDRAGALDGAHLDLPASLAGRYRDALAGEAASAGDAGVVLAAGPLALAPLVESSLPFAVLVRETEPPASSAD